MTSQEIKHSDTYQESPDVSQAIWLKEIAYQLAVFNERESSRENLVTQPVAGSPIRESGESYKPIVAVLRSCAQTIRENHMQGWQAVDYLLSYATTVEHAQGAQKDETGSAREQRFSPEVQE